MCLPQSTVRDPFTSNLLLTQSWLSEEPKLTQSSSLPITSLPLDTRVFLMPWLGLWSSLVLDEVMWRHRASEGSLPTSTVGYLYLKEQKGWGYKLGGWEWMRWEMGMEEGTPRKGEKGTRPSTLSLGCAWTWFLYQSRLCRWDRADFTINSCGAITSVVSDSLWPYGL